MKAVFCVCGGYIDDGGDDEIYNSYFACGCVHPLDHDEAQSGDVMVVVSEPLGLAR
ncbi:hypothetical protein [Frankia sp. Cj3]|uniref:hypothetical protein n=1 Tax=Frankia sp. Cj3 TaxID=2880976 RepID=UPI001EF65B7A|nr:hypothetical protein [Frankia sp. Cj3]